MMTEFLLILSVLAAPPSGAAQAGPRLAPAVQDVFACDFEEAFDEDYDGWPDGWLRSRSRQLPDFVRIEIVEEEARANRCLQVVLDGGGAAVSSPSFALSPQLSLVVTLRIKVDGLVHDGAWATLSLVDAEGKVLQAHSSPPLTGTIDWQSVQIGPIAASGRVHRGIVSLHVMPLGKREDLAGSAYFDDLRVSPLPQMLLGLNSTTGLYTTRAAAELTCEVSGAHVSRPRVRFELLDQRGQKLAEATTPLRSSAAGVSAAAPSADGLAGYAKWAPPIPDYGFYRVRATLEDQPTGRTLLDRTQSLAVLRPFPPPGRSEFGWSLPAQEEPYSFAILAPLLAQAGLGWAKMPVWYDPRDTARGERIAWFAEQLSIQGIELVGMLDQPPPDLREVFREKNRPPAATVFAEPALWQPLLAPIMTRLSLKVRWWQLGGDDDASFLGHPQLETKIAEIKRHLSEYGQRIHIGFGWRWIFAPPQAADPRSPRWSYLLYGGDPPLTAQELAAYLQSDQPAGRADEQRAPKRWVLLPPLPRTEYSLDDRVRDLVLRMLAAKSSGAHAVFVPQPFSDERGILNADGSPGELFVPWRTTAALVGGSDCLGEIRLAGGSCGCVFARAGRAVMAVWNDQPTAESFELSEEIEHFDVWGRSLPAPLAERGGRKVYELHVNRMPTFITGLSEAIARWQAAVRIENPQLSSIAGHKQTIVVLMLNTFSQPVSGELLLHAPKNWDVDSRPTPFRIAAGDTLRLALPVALLPGANSGPQTVQLEFNVADRRFSVHRLVQVGLDDVQVELTTQLRPDGMLLVQQQLTNLSSQPLSFQCELFAPGRRRETRQLTTAGNERTTLTFLLPRGEELIGKQLWLRAEEIGGPRVLNYTLLAER